MAVLVLAKLIEKREAFKDLMEQETKLTFNITAKRYYEAGNRPEKLLAGTIKPISNVNYITKIKDKKEEFKYSTSDII